MDIFEFTIIALVFVGLLVLGILYISSRIQKYRGGKWLSSCSCGWKSVDHNSSVDALADLECHLMFNATHRIKQV